MSKMPWLLTKEQLASGLMFEDDEDYVYLKHDGEVIGRWTSTSSTTTIQALQQAAHQALQELKSGVEIQKVEAYKI